MIKKQHSEIIKKHFPDTEFASLHDGKVTEDRFNGFNPPFDTLRGWYSNQGNISKDIDNIRPSEDHLK